MLNQIYKRCLCGLIIIAIVSTFTACVNNTKTEPVNKAVDSEKTNIIGDTSKNNIQTEPVNKSKTVDNVKSNNINDISKKGNQLLDSWLGDYIFTEYINSEDCTKFYEVFISKENNNYSAKIETDDEGAGVYSCLQATISGDTKHIGLIFSDYLLDETNTNKPYNLGDNLLSFTKTDTGISTHWGKIAPTNDINKVDGTYFKIRENSEGYIGHWYTSIPFTGGNSTAIEIKEMSNKSVSFYLYFCRTYSFEGTNIKLENNIARFVDNNDDYKTSGTIEFVNNSIIVNIEKTNMPILETGKTVFNYMVSEFNAVDIAPENEAINVDLGKGIEIDFDRRILPTVNPTVFLRKTNVPSGSDDGFIEMSVEIKGNRLIMTPDYDAMKISNEIIQAGQQYELTIDEGQYSDDVGNINSKLNLTFTTKN